MEPLESIYAVNESFEYLELLEYLEYLPSIDGALNNIVVFLSLFVVMIVCYGCYKFINIFF